MKKIILTAAVGVAILAAAVAMDVTYQTIQAKDSWFDPSNLKRAPGNLVVVRATHFPEVYGKIRERHDDDDITLTRVSGRNITLRDLIAEAYGTNPGQVVLPPEAAQEHFDFVVTVSGDVRERLQSAIREATGYTARVETRETKVFNLKVANADLPGMAISPASEDEDVQYKDGRLYFKHKTAGYLIRGLQDGLGQPVMDETGLTNSYDFSVAWNMKTTRAMQAGGWHLENVQKVLNGWGLGLEPATESLDMIVVQKVASPSAEPTADKAPLANH
jgi:uncharacterized protein (TIGR03435 family)